MRGRWLGWAGFELEVDGTTLVVDALQDAGAVFAAFGDRVAGTPLPVVVAPRAGRAVAALVTHLHRDHADAAAISGALGPTGVVLEPPAAGGDTVENLALVQADQELAATGLPRHRLADWSTHEAGPFTVTALPAVDGLGEPQVSWLVEAGGVRVLHLGDTTFHGSWWRIARRLGPFDLALLPVNGAVVSFPHRRPPSPFGAAMDPEQAAVAAEILAPGLALPIHADGYDIDGVYRPTAAPAARFVEAAAARGVRAALPQLGVPFEVGPGAA